MNEITQADFDKLFEWLDKATPQELIAELDKRKHLVNAHEKVFTPYYNCDYVYIVSQKDKDHNWNKLCKSQYLWWDTEKEAINWLNGQPDWFQRSNAVFKCLMCLSEIEKIYEVI